MVFVVHLIRLPRTSISLALRAAPGTFGQVPRDLALAQAFLCSVLWIVAVICEFLDDNALKEININQDSEKILLLSFTHAAAPAHLAACRGWVTARSGAPSPSRHCHAMAIAPSWTVL